MDPRRIIGIVLARNEERYAERVVRNIADFCDRILLCDNASRDSTPRIFAALAREMPGAVFHEIKHPRESHELLKPYCGTGSWVFAADGDEIYDPSGLLRMRQRLMGGEFDGSWTVFGNVLNATSLSADNATASGYLAPPCRSMTKLYNFSAISSWDGDCLERLHGGEPVYRRGYAAASRRYLHEETPWEKADFRCLHLCFQPRSAVDAPGAVRRNIMETYGTSIWRRLLGSLRAGNQSWKKSRYMRGPLVSVDASPFFPQYPEVSL